MWLAGGRPPLRRDSLGGSRMNAVRALLLPVALACTACGRSNLAGSWSLCVAGPSATPVCTTAQVRPSARLPALRWSAIYLVRYSPDAGSIRQVPRPRRTGCGSLLRDEDGTYTLQLDIACDAVWEADAGGLSAEHLTLEGDSLAGSWYQSCYSGCDAHGRLALVRLGRSRR